MKGVRLGLMALAGMAALCGAVKVGLPHVDGAAIKTHVRAVASPPRAPDMLHYLPVLR